MRVDSIINFPEEAEKPMVEVATQKRQVLAVAIHGKTDLYSLRKLADKTLTDLTNLPGITQVEISGVRKPEIGIEVSESSLREHKLSFDDIAIALKANSIDIHNWRSKNSFRRNAFKINGESTKWYGI